MNVYREGIFGTGTKDAWEAPSLGEFVREAAAEFGVLKGHGSPWNRCPADSPYVGGDPSPAELGTCNC